MQYKDYYKILGVERGAGADEIKRAYRKLARKYHPDVSKERDSEERFKEVGEAYEVLRDPEKRAAYDQLGNDWRAGQEFRPPPGWDVHVSTGPGGPGAGFSGFSDFFESLFGGAPPGASRYTRSSRDSGFGMRGSDQTVSTRITLEEAYRGASRRFDLTTPDGRSRTIDVKIPPGVTAGQKIRVSGQGGAGRAGAKAGDLYLELQFMPHRWFRAEGRDILVEVPVAPWEAALGRTITVPTLGARVDLKLPQGAQSGQKLRLKGRGLPGTPPGDQFVVVKIVTPPADSDAARAFYERMERELPMQPRREME